MARSDTVINRLGETKLNNIGSEMTIISYINCNDIKVKFKNGYISNSVRYYDFINGDIKNPFDITVCGIGYLGNGEYKAYINGKQTIQYATWQGMLHRCYDIKTQEKHPTYIGCTVCEEWHNFQNFAKWYDNNIYEVEGQIIHLDKDWIKKGNKIYSPDTCIFVPKIINSLIVNRKKSRGNLPLGICIHRDKYVVFCANNTKKQVYLGSHNTPELAFQVYKTFKESYIKQVAELYKYQIPKKLYDIMYKYEIHMDD